MSEGHLFLEELVKRGRGSQQSQEGPGYLGPGAGCAIQEETEGPLGISSLQVFSKGQCTKATKPRWGNEQGATDASEEIFFLHISIGEDGRKGKYLGAEGCRKVRELGGREQLGGPIGGGGDAAAKG